MENDTDFNKYKKWLAKIENAFENNQIIKDSPQSKELIEAVKKELEAINKHEKNIDRQIELLERFNNEDKEK